MYELQHCITTTADLIEQESWNDHKAPMVKEYEESLANLKTIKIITYIVLGFLCLYLIGIPLIFIARSIFRSQEAKIVNTLAEQRFQYLKAQAAEIAKRTGLNWCLGKHYRVMPLWNQQGFAYMWLDTGFLLVIPKQEIKGVELEHVHLGSTTTTSMSHGGAGVAVGISKNVAVGVGGGKSSGTSHTQSQYEYRLDVFSTNPEYPCVTCVFSEADGKYAKQAKGALMK